jgi:hypothetical protein
MGNASKQETSETVSYNAHGIIRILAEQAKAYNKRLIMANNADGGWS